MLFGKSGGIKMDIREKKPSSWVLTLGVLALLVATGIGGFVLYKFNQELNVDELVFDTWLNEKREVLEGMNMEYVSVDNTGQPAKDDYITRSYGGTLEWKTTLFEVEGSMLSSPAFIDMNNDGTLEIVIASEGDAVYALGNKGQYYWSEPYTDDLIEYLGQTPQTSGLDYDPPHIFASVIADRKSVV